MVGYGNVGTVGERLHLDKVLAISCNSRHRLQFRAISCYIVLSHVISCYLMLSRVIPGYLMLSGEKHTDNHVITPPGGEITQFLLSRCSNTFLLSAQKSEEYVLSRPAPQQGWSAMLSHHNDLDNIRRITKTPCYPRRKPWITTQNLLSHAISCYLMLCDCVCVCVCVMWLCECFSLCVCVFVCVWVCVCG